MRDVLHRNNHDHARHALVGCGNALQVLQRIANDLREINERLAANE
jgi:hypothetical protein